MAAPFVTSSGEVSTNETSPWVYILKKEGLELQSDHAKGDIAVTSNAFGKIQFSSEQNNVYFGKLDDVRTVVSTSSAWIGDAAGSGVMVLSAPATTIRQNLIAELCTLYGIEVDNSSFNEIGNFLKRIDSDKKVAASLTKAPQSVFAGVTTSGLWCVADRNTYKAQVRLCYTLDGLDILLDNALGWITSVFSDVKPKKSSTPELTIILRRLSTYGSGTYNTIEPYRETELSLAFQIPGFVLNVDLSKTTRELTLVPISGDSIADMIRGAFDSPKNIDLGLFPDQQRNDPFVSIFDHVHLWYIRVLNDPTQTTSRQTQWGAGLLAFWKPNGVTIAALLTYDSVSAKFVGKLMFQHDFGSAADRRSLRWDARLSPDAILKKAEVDLAQLGDAVDLWKMIGFSADDQPPIPHNLTNAEVSFQRAAGTKGTGSVFNFTADLVQFGQTSNSQVAGAAPSGFTWDGAGISLTIVSPDFKPSAANPKPTSSKAYGIDVYTTFALRSPSSYTGKPISPALFALFLHYDASKTDSAWLLRASAQNLSVGLLGSFFDSGAESIGAMAVLGKLTVRDLEVIYTYKKGSASSFLITAVLALGGLELDLSYQYISSIAQVTDVTATTVYLKDNPNGGKLPKSDDAKYKTGTGKKISKFIGSLRPSSPGSTIAQIADSIVENGGDSLPSWVGDIVVNPVSKAGVSSPTAEVEYSTTEDTINKTRLSVLTVWLSIAGLSLTFVQSSSTSTDPGVVDRKSIVKRILRMSVDQIPLLHDIPLVGKLPQPFDSLEYLWVDDQTDKPIGITRAELRAIQAQFPSDIPPLRYKELKATKNDDDILLAGGHHFLILVNSAVILDHVFNASRAETEADAGKKPPPDAPAPPPPKAPAKPQPTKGATTSNAGPLTISALGLEYKESRLIVSIDATLKLGPISFSVIGFEIKLELSKVRLSDLSKIVTDHLVEVSLKGIGVGIQQGPLTLKGAFIHDQTSVAETYSGGVAVGFKVWQVLAIGQYQIRHAVGEKEPFRAVFVYGKLDGPLVELEFATISGVRLGFGYNYAVRMPELNELHRFPFISDEAAKKSGNDPLAVLNAMTGEAKPFVYAKDGACWFCAGMTISAFESLTLTAVLMFNLDTGKDDPNEAGVTIGMLADGIFQMPPELTPELTLFYIEIIVSVELNFVSGYIAANAVLAPASHVYVPQARLQGGASFYTWFGKNSHAGDWVVSIGGFPRGYNRPAHYPNPDRVGLNFTLGDMIQVIGVGYLAITPKCVMVGGSLHMSLSVGPVSAYVDVVFDAFVNFKPFHFRAYVSLSVGVECNIDILFIHIHISIHLAAELMIWGPDKFGGHAYVDFWFFGFGIDFGDEESGQTDALSLDQFYAMIARAGPDPSKAVTHSEDADTQIDLENQHKFSIEEGLLPGKAPPAEAGADGHTGFPSTGAHSMWKIKAGSFVFRIDTPFALSSARIVLSDSTDANAKLALPNKKPGVDVPTVYSRPMHSKEKHPIDSSLEISVYQIDDPKNPIPQAGFRGELVLKSAPVAMWAVYDAAADPLQTRQPAGLYDAKDSKKDLVLAVRVQAPAPYLYNSLIVDFDATAAMKAVIPSPVKGGFVLPTNDTEKTEKYAGHYFQPEVEDLDVDGQTARWASFADTWCPRTQPPASETVKKRQEAVDMLAKMMEWDIRPPEEMKGNVDMPAKDAPVTINGARENADHRTDWDLLTAAPVRLTEEIATRYPQLPFVTAKA